MVREVDELIIFDALQKLLIILNRGENILNILNFIKNIFVTLNYNLKPNIIQNVKNSLHYLSHNKHQYTIGEQEIININLILTNINNRNLQN